MSSPGFEAIEGFLFDLDGCVYEGETPIPSAVALIGRLRSLGKRVSFISNNSTQSAKELAEKLGRMGIASDKGDFFIPTDWDRRLPYERLRSRIRLSDRRRNSDAFFAGSRASPGLR